ncbi:hypothetical protein [Chloroflexus sp.]|uniref:hypothetical protein n=1 Tax=Chloroflexus sp. TaxID=1904827 RepID=UPI002628D11D|nr:hypothetical protein [uncultured Chloroflexus sp.]
MNVRDELLTALVREVLGPRDGCYETLPADHDPRQEYITGVLEPRNARTQDDRIEDQSSAEVNDGTLMIAAMGWGWR